VNASFEPEDAAVDIVFPSRQLAPATFSRFSFGASAKTS